MTSRMWTCFVMDMLSQAFKRTEAAMIPQVTSRVGIGPQEFSRQLHVYTINSNGKAGQ